MTPKLTPRFKLSKLVKAAQSQKRGAEAALGKKIPEKFRLIREGQLLDALQKMEFLQQFGGEKKGKGAMGAGAGGK